MKATRLFAAVLIWIAYQGNAWPSPRDDLNIIHTQKSLYSNILVYESEGKRCIRLAHNTAADQSCIKLFNLNEHVLDYTKLMMAALYVNPAPQKILVIGLGGGIIPKSLRTALPKAAIDVVEIDEAMVSVAKDYFGIVPSEDAKIAVGDGRVFVKRKLKAKEKYDLIMLDAYDKRYIPEHMLTKEFLLEVRGLLAPGGVLAANTWDGTRLSHYEYATYFSVYGEFYSLKSDNGNRIILAGLSELPPQETLAKNAAQLESKFRAFGIEKSWLLPSIVVLHDWPGDTPLLTDQYSPSNLLNH